MRLLIWNYSRKESFLKSKNIFFLLNSERIAAPESWLNQVPSNQEVLKALKIIVDINF